MAPTPAMHTMPLLLKQSLRSSIRISHTTTRPTNLSFRPTPPSSVSIKPTPRTFTVCLRWQFRQDPRLLDASEDKSKGRPNTYPEEISQTSNGAHTPNYGSPSEVDAGTSRTANISASEINRLVEESTIHGTERGILDHLEAEKKREEEERTGKSQSSNSDAQSGGGTRGEGEGGLPSYLEGRRSRVSKQFTTMMDNIQSNVFVAGQRLNDLTGYSGIEALKNEIQHQEIRLRNARSQVRIAKDAYTAAINSRSTSQREVNELLQRKHAWSPTDLERFTLLYRNDHTNEVAETESQEALSHAEREAEEAAAQLSKSILSRYHEEQVWSDKIRRMSTWGTWGLMGVNVLLFLIFQIAVEPWRRRRLVKGFEDKVVEAIEKEKSINPAAFAGASASAIELEKSVPASTESSIIAATEAPDNGLTEVLPATTEAQDQTSLEVTSPSLNNLSGSLYSRIVGISSSPISLEYWRQVLNELISDRSVAVTQRDLTVATVQSATIGAAVMGIILALVNPR
ncbi:hypothetical protein N7478_005056 [Penicillium angulare]|uniref:uncharacterized protein n=1 Tax=Penicillium angulare TaxID=116970 RepID=UPI0025412A07|nr:uncharacterized protein N7478_005056 [Penicillium angulare]KAJ5279684.1 hypothetical protein N7478_005056 [Penicillium angulare]